MQSQVDGQAQSLTEASLPGSSPGQPPPMRGFDQGERHEEPSDSAAITFIRSQGAYDVPITRHRPSNDPEEIGITSLRLKEEPRFSAFFAPEFHDGRVITGWDGCNTAVGRICEVRTEAGETYTITVIYETPADTVKARIGDPLELPVVLDDLLRSLASGLTGRDTAAVRALYPGVPDSELEVWWELLEDDEGRRAESLEFQPVTPLEVDGDEAEIRTLMARIRRAGEGKAIPWPFRLVLDVGSEGSLQVRELRRLWWSAPRDPDQVE